MASTEAWAGELVDQASMLVMAEGEGGGEEEGRSVATAHFQRRRLDLLALPDELLVRVLASLSGLADASNAFAACHRLYSIYLDDHYWRYKYLFIYLLILLILFSYYLSGSIIIYLRHY
jgi:hypothetical protein